MKYEKISGWGNLENVFCNVYQFENEKKLKIYIKNKIIIRGNGSRMATALYKNTTISSLRHNNIISFDEKLGLIKVQSGLI